MTTVFLSGSAVDFDFSKESKNTLVSELWLRNYEVTQNPASDYLIMINHKTSTYNQFIKHGGKKKNATLIRVEPPSVFPAQYKDAILLKYGTVITPGSILDKRDGKIFVGWPYRYNKNPSAPEPDEPNLLSESITNNRINSTLENWKSRPNIIVMIGANKVSPTSSSNYSLRRNFARTTGNSYLGVYGFYWEKKLIPRLKNRVITALSALKTGYFPNLREIFGDLFVNYSSFKGLISNKHELLQKSKFSLVIENSNYTISEKLFDVIINGCIPLYIGPELSQMGLPTHIAIKLEVDFKKNPPLLDNVVKGVTDAEAEKILLAGRKFLESSTFLEFWTEQSVYEKILDYIESQRQQAI